MATLYQTNKKTGVTYVIESKSYWDKEKKQPRSHRTIIGKIDPDTGEVVPTKKYKRKKKASSPSDVRGPGNKVSTASGTGSEDISGRISELEQQVIRLREEKEALIRDLKKVLQQYGG